MSPGDQIDLKCGIGVLSSVIAGFTTFEEMIAASKATATPTYRGQDLPKTATFLADYF